MAQFDVAKPKDGACHEQVESGARWRGQSLAALSDEDGFRTVSTIWFKKALQANKSEGARVRLAFRSGCKERQPVTLGACRSFGSLETTRNLDMEPLKAHKNEVSLSLSRRRRPVSLLLRELRATQQVRRNH